ncbi:hypothetical protein EI546_08990 [Aequorivita sp. H23M31]|uniref:Uncharacterized protein n=1 Tax=Aequorivita ciconiae TaxID=2494375 RepID=A0A410G3Q2_9FLAO|nr:hypothetical protein [Aequorivita sp. H23M31]QAA81845.1 hypothetical protein EI546_08990 [Aequorivita sp. H23M31]
MNDLYEIIGRVIDGAKKGGIANLRVEAWDKDVKYHDLLGSCITNADGGFEMSFDSTYFREFAPEEKPDIFFKIYLGKKLIKSTEDTPLKNAERKVNVTLTIDLPEYMMPEGRDRVSTEQMLRIAAFFQDSDFAGVYSDYRKKAGTSINHLSDMIMNTVNKFDFEPIKRSPVREEEIIDQKLVDVKKNMESQNVTIGEIREYDPKLDRTSIMDINFIHKNIKEGQRINLYEEEGVVKYYTFANEKTESRSETPLQNTTTEKRPDEVVTLKTEVSQLKRQLNEVHATHQREISLRDERIKKLEKSVTQFDKFSSEFESLKNQVSQLSKTPKKPIRKKDDK